MSSPVKDPASFRDPSGFIFSYDGLIYRQVNLVYRTHYEQLMRGGLYRELVAREWLIPHDVVELPLSHPEAYIYLKPEQVPFISYPYEWSFDMLKDAALLTLNIAVAALKYGMTLKDASAYNVQYHKGKMTFIDTLSFEIWDRTKPWSPYRQFCEHFLAPLALMHHTKAPMQGMQLGYPDGIPLPLASALLPWKTKWNLHLYLHIHLNGAVKGNNTSNKKVTFTEQKMKNILSSLEAAVSPLRLDQKGTWSDYYSEANERDGYVTNKQAIVENWLERETCKTAFDAGANDGTFSRSLAKKGIAVLSADGDHGAVNSLYKTLKSAPAPVHPLLFDLANPSPAIGVNNTERSSLTSRLHVDLVMALAVIHHLAIGRNIPFERIAALFAGLGNTLIIEFVPKEDPKVQGMLETKPDVYDWYNEGGFRSAFGKRFNFVREEKVAPSARTLFLLQRL
ncbi:MAG TPA: hypothetical protein VGB56_05675 [Flavisolibacter sp.]